MARSAVVILFLIINQFFVHNAQAQSKLELRDPSPQHYKLTARASKLDPRVKAHPEIGFLIETKRGQPADVQHASVVPGGRAKKDSATGAYPHEDVWRYLFTQPVDEVGKAVPMDDSCNKNQRQ